MLLATQGILIAEVILEEEVVGVADQGVVTVWHVVKRDISGVTQYAQKHLKVWETDMGWATEGQDRLIPHLVKH